MRALEIAAQTAGHDVAAVYGAIMVSIYVSPDPDEAMARAIELFEKELALGRRAALTYISDGVRWAAPGLRERLVAVHQRFAETFIASAVVVAGQGFLAATHRSALTNIRLQARSSFPRQIVADLDEAATWLAGQLPGYRGPEIAAVARSLLSRPLSGG